MVKNNTIIVSGRFNILHLGHVRLLRFAKEQGGLLIVAVESDRIAGKLAIISENLRLEGVQCISWVNEAFIFDEPIKDLISRMRPAIVVKGREYESIYNEELEILEQYGGKLIFSSGDSIFSSFDLISGEFLTNSHGKIKFPKDYLDRHAIDKARLINLINQFANLKIYIIGDLIVDEYITCEPLGMSQEEPTIVVMPLNSKLFLGGAGIVAAHAAGLGGAVNFFSVTGNDTLRDFAFESLTDSRVIAQLLLDKSRPTTLKQRYRSKGKSLLRVNHLRQNSIAVSLQKEFLTLLEEKLEDTDLLVFSDFNYGCLPQQLVDQIIIMAKSKGIILVADSQSSSQIGNIARFNGMDLLTPTEHEARISTRNRDDGLVVLAEQLRHKSDAKNLLLKLGEEGLLIHADDSQGAWITDRVDALNKHSLDVAGAGDSLLITSAMTLAIGGTIWEAAYLGSLAAAIQVGRIGNIPMSLKEILQELR